MVLIPYLVALAEIILDGNGGGDYIYGEDDGDWIRGDDAILDVAFHGKG